MAVTVNFFNRFYNKLATKAIDLDNDDLKIILMGTGYTFDKDAHHGYSDVSANELAGSPDYGYDAGGQSLTGTTVTEDDTNDRTRFTCDDPEWTASGGSIGPAKSAIIYDNTEAGDSLICCIDFGGNVTVPDGSSLLLQDIVIDLKQGT